MSDVRSAEVGCFQLDCLQRRTGASTSPSTSRPGSSGSGGPDCSLAPTRCESLEWYCRRQLCWQVSQLHHAHYSIDVRIPGIPRPHLLRDFTSAFHDGSKGQEHIHFVWTTIANLHTSVFTCLDLQSPEPPCCNISCTSSVCLYVPASGRQSQVPSSPHQEWHQALRPRTST